MVIPYPIWARIFVGHYFAARSLALNPFRSLALLFSRSQRGEPPIAMVPSDS
jgi:hypothetical protein